MINSIFKYYVIFLAIALHSASFAASEITWSDLEPAINESLLEPFEALEEEQVYAIRELIQYEQYASTGNQISDNGKIYLEDLYKRFEDWQIDAKELLNLYNQYENELKEVAGQTNPSLDGASVKIPGYLLPLEFDDQKVKQFLLVPYVGACIHTPPPPPNQIIHVNSEMGTIISDMYSPVWVEGVLNIEQRSSTLELVDGSSDIPVAYEMDAEMITLYE